jgi:predicted nucleotide-binding protein (sugar kinase/HSP70/actin superfamily)
LSELCDVLAKAGAGMASQRSDLMSALTRARERFERVPRRAANGILLVGVIGEIFCRLNAFSNEDVIRKLEAQGAEAWLSDISEWLWYTNSERQRKLRLMDKRFSKAMASAKLKALFMHRDEQALLAPLRGYLRGREEPEMKELLECGRPYLPQEGAMGEMVVSIGKAVYLHRKGVDGILDISPFTCMNGIVSEAIYPLVSKHCQGIPVRNFYFDGTQGDLERDIGIFLELCRNYQRRKHPTATASGP